MTTINHETYCGQNLITLLLKAGFDWQDYFVAHFIDEHFHWEIPLHIAQKWLRDVKGIYIEIVALENKRSITNSDGWTFHYEYSKPTFDCNIQNERCETICTLDDSFDTYEQAQEAGEKKALEILEKGE